MSAAGIAGIAIFISMAMLLMLALCRCAALADKGVEGYLPEEEQPVILLADLKEQQEGQPDVKGKQPAPRLSL